MAWLYMASGVSAPPPPPRWAKAVIAEAPRARMKASASGVQFMGVSFRGSALAARWTNGRPGKGLQSPSPARRESILSGVARFASDLRGAEDILSDRAP